MPPRPSFRHRLARARHRVLRPAVLAATACVTSSYPLYPPLPRTPGTHEHHIQWGGRDRSYIVHIPTGYDGARPMPIVFVFHGSKGTPGIVMKESGMNGRADAHGFLAVYPAGVSRSWNMGICCRYAYAHYVDDVGFVGAVISELARTLRVDTTRVYSTGYSDGGALSYVLACELPRRIAAVAPVAGALGDRPCHPPLPVSVLIFHGTADQNIPYAGHPSPRKGSYYRWSVPATGAIFAALDRCAAGPDSTVMPRVVRTAWTGCADSTEVVIDAIRGGLHAWPGGEKAWLLSDAPSRDVIASDTIWAFFARHHR